MTDGGNDNGLNLRWFIPLMMIAMGGFLMMKGPASNNAQLAFRVGTILLGAILLLVLNVPRGSK